MRTNPVRESLTGGGASFGIMAAEFFTPGFCRIAANAGAEFIIFDMEPMIETRDQAEKLASWCRYRPEGVRGVGFGVAHDDYEGGDVITAMRLENQRTLVIALIETATGIDNADAILSVPGIDVGWLGHYDLTNTMGMTAEFDRPEFHAAVDTWLGACRRHGKAPGILASTVAAAQEWRKKGVRCLCYGIDIGVFQTALSTALQALKADSPPI
jgi:2-keto-3-deoxy-L-rhamnonate aldolase RhmA